MRKVLEPGDTFSDWVVTSKEYYGLDRDGLKYKYARVRCVCGYEKEMRPSTLINGKSKKCVNCARRMKRTNKALPKRKSKRVSVCDALRLFL